VLDLPAVNSRPDLLVDPQFLFAQFPDSTTPFAIELGQLPVDPG
jgi:hypothetical protein